MEPLDKPTDPGPSLSNMGRSDSSSGESVDNSPPPAAATAPVYARPRLPSRKSSGTIIVPRDSIEAIEPHHVQYETDDGAMSPRRSTEDIAALGQQARDELRMHAKALQDSLLTIFNRIETVREEHDKLDSNNKFLQKYIGDLMSTSKITSTGARGKK